MPDTVKLSENSKYGFAIGRVRSLETALLDRARYERLAHARDAAEFLSLLRDTPYGRFFEGDAGFDRAMDAAEADNYDFFAQYAADTWLLDIFRLRGEVRRLKRALKEAVIADEEKRTPAEELARLVTVGKPGKALAAVKAALEDYAEKRDPARVDIIIDQLEQAIAFAEAKKKSDFLAGYLRLHADLENLRTLLRLGALERNQKEHQDTKKELEGAMLEGGGLSKELLLLLAGEEPGSIGARLGPPYRAVVEEGVAQLASGRSLARMERLSREAELGLLRQSRYATFGHEPLVTFFLLRENEARNLRALYAAKVAGLGEEITSELVAYAG